MTKPPLKARNVKSAAKKERRGFSRQGHGSREPVHAERNDVADAQSPLQSIGDLHVHARYKALPESAILPFPPLGAPGWVQIWLVRVTPLVSLSKRV